MEEDYLRKKSSDQFFKKLVHNKYILASMVGDLVSEFEGLTSDQVMQYLPLEGNGDTVKGSKTELVSDTAGPIYLDSVFHIGSPKGNLGIVVAVEGQGPSMAREDLARRELVYACRLVYDQSKEHKNNEGMYHDLKRTVCIWVHLSPSVHRRNRTFRNRMYETEDFSDSPPRISDMDYVEIIDLNLGGNSEDTGEKSRRINSILNTLFDRSLDDSEKKRRLTNTFNITISESIISEARNMGALAEDYDIVERRGFKKGLDVGMQEGMQKGRAEAFDSIVAEYTQLVIQAISEKGMSLDAALESIVNLKGYRQSVRANVLKQIKDMQY